MAAPSLPAFQQHGSCSLNMHEMSAQITTTETSRKSGLLAEKTVNHFPHPEYNNWMLLMLFFLYIFGSQKQTKKKDIQLFPSAGDESLTER